MRFLVPKNIQDMENIEKELETNLAHCQYTEPVLTAPNGMKMTLSFHSAPSGTKMVSHIRAEHKGEVILDMPRAYMTGGLLCYLMNSELRYA